MNKITMTLQVDHLILTTGYPDYYIQMMTKKAK